MGLVPSRSTFGRRRPLFGRGEVVDSAIRALEHARVVTLVGDGGFGTSRIAAEVIDKLASAGWTTSTIDLADGDVRANPIVLANPLTTETGDLPAVVLIDNLHVAPEWSTSLIAALQRTPTTQLVVTGRHPLRIVGEHVVSVGSLEPDAAAQLFTDVSASVGGKNTIGRSHEHDVAEICALLDGWPLAIELAARRTAVQSVAELLAALRSSTLTSVLDGGASADSSRSIRGVVAETTAGLDDGQRDLAMRLAGLADWWTIDEVAELVPAHALGAISSLVANQVVEQGNTDDMTVFRVRRPYRELFGGEGEQSSTTVRVRSLQRFARSAVDGLLTGAWQTGDVKRWYAAIERRRRDLRAAAADAVRHDPVASAEITLALAMCAVERGNLDDDRLILDRITAALEPLDDGSGSLGLMLRGFQLHVRVEAIDPTTDTARLARELDAAVADALAVDDPRIALTVLAISVRSARTIGHHEQAERHAGLGLALAESASLPAARATFELLGAMIAHVQLRFGDAALLATRAHMRARRLDLPAVASQALLMFRQLPAGTANLPAVLPTPQDVLESLDTTGHHRSTIGVALGISVECLAAGDLATAARAAAFGTRSAAAVGLPAGVGTGVMVMVALAVGAGELELAARLHGALSDHHEVVLRSTAPGHRAIYDRSVGLARHQLGEAAYARELSRGASRSWLSIVEDGLSLADSLAGPPAALTTEMSPTASSLTRRELEVLRLLASGIPNKEIAARLGMATKTTMHHTSKIYSKLGVRGRGEAAAWARRAGIV